VDSGGVLGVAGPPDPEKCNDYVAAVVRADPGRFIGFASVNPAWRGPRAAVAELRRAVSELGLAGLKLYPMYQHWAPNDRDLAFPVYQAAGELGIPVMIHQAGSTRIDAALELGRPALLDDVGRCFRDLRVIIAHCGHPWVDEALFLLTKHPNFYGELSYLLASITRRDLFLLLQRCEPMFVPLEKLFFGTDYPGFLYDPVALSEKVRSVNEEAGPLGLDPIRPHKIDGLLGGNFAAFLGLGS
jgi:predicted TIM-barrel fold metal-dependent hydrolase